MSVIPTVSADGVGAIAAGQLNAYTISCYNTGILRTVVGQTGMTTFLQGTNVPNDGGQGNFYWDYTSTAADNNSTVIRPYGVIYGAWIRTALSSSAVGDVSNTTVIATGSTTAVSLANRFGQMLSLTDFGAACNGTTDDTTAVQSAITLIGARLVNLTVPGPTKISGPLTFSPNTQLVFDKGGYFVGVAGTELIQTQSQIVAGRTLAFSNCLARATSSQNVYPEWFGAVNNGTTDCAPAFNAAVYYLQNVGGIIDMLGGTYLIRSTVTINKSYITLQGAGNNNTIIKTSDSTVYALFVGGSVGSPTRNVMLRDFSITSYAPSTTTIGLQLYYTAFPIVERMQISDFLYGVSMQQATNTQLTKVGATYSGLTNNTRGFSINGDGGGNPSSNLRDCYTNSSVSPTNSTLTGQTGFYVYGTYMSDLQFDNCETAKTNYGFFFDYSTVTGGTDIDIIVRNPIVDQYWNQGIFVNGLPTGGTISILGGYSNPAATNTVGTTCESIYLNSCIGRVLIEGHAFENPANYASTHVYGIKAISSTGVIINGNSFSNLYGGVYGNSFGYSQIIGNIFKYSDNHTGGGSTYTFVQVFGGARVMVSNNAFDGYADIGVYFDSTSDGCGIVGNCADTAHITTRFSNNGTNPVGSANGSTGLNSGV